MLCVHFGGYAASTNFPNFKTSTYQNVKSSQFHSLTKRRELSFEQFKFVGGTMQIES